MRVLEFIVKGQKLTKNPLCDFENLVSGTKGYLKAQFTFSEEWSDCILIARFFRGDEEHAVQIINNTCEIPPEALTGMTFRVSVLGQRNDYQIRTNQVVVRQEVSR